MNHSDNDWFDFFKDRRFPPVFFVTLVIIFGGLIAIYICTQFILEYDLKKYFVYGCPGLALLLAIMVLKMIRSWQAGRRDRYKSSPLSRDEVSKARSKLMKQK